MMTVNDLKRWRRRRGLTQVEAAKKLGYSRRGLQDVEARGDPIPLKLELAIAGLNALEPME